jgi:hypothetical protein
MHAPLTASSLVLIELLAMNRLNCEKSATMSSSTHRYGTVKFPLARPRWRRRRLEGDEGSVAADDDDDDEGGEDEEEEDEEEEDIVPSLPLSPSPWSSWKKLSGP